MLAAAMFQIGQILDNRYQLVEPLKIFGTRQTWRSIDLVDQTACIIKLLGFHPALEWQDYEQFEREIKILKSLKCSQVPRYLSHFFLELEELHWSVLVQAEISGTSLQGLLDQHHCFTEDEIRQIAIDLLQILSELHGQYPPVLHRDINPNHVIFTPDRSLYLVGFGAAQRGIGSMGDFTQTGTYGYVPLEQYGGQALPASDLYAVGATILHLLTGVCPADLPQSLSKLSIRSLAAIDDRFAEWLEKMLEVDVAHRFKTAKQALASLLQTQSDHQAIEIPSNDRERALLFKQNESNRVTVYQSSEQLQVNIGKRGIHLTDALWLGIGTLTGGVSVLMLFSQVHPLLSVLCGLDSLPLLGIGFVSALGEASLTLKDRSLWIQWKCLGIPYRRVQQSSPIMAIDSAHKGITIQTQEQQYSIGQFSPELSEAEAQWLTEEIDRWVGRSAISKTQN